ncbi:MAG: saccharopine dehydrogenase NADP-binding domain-containing protein [Planctomycetes bacterium]|nr:saccharopine dehydrogenase NADP-binding domain-containing protein [Planctomycetota bacterium]
MSSDSKKAVVLGAGMVGTLMAKDLASGGEFKVTLADRSEAALAKAKAYLGPDVPIETATCDLSDPAALKTLAESADVVLGALSSHLGYSALQTLAQVGTPYCDISFMAENAMDWNDLAREHGTVCVVDCGVAPGMSNLLTGAGVSMLDRADEVEIYVGGLPKNRTWPFEYKAGFAPSDVIEEYTRPSRIVEHGQVVVREALTEPELMEFDGIGTLEAFNTDGLRSLIETLDVPHMKEKTLRYPGHIELMRVFRATGLFQKETIEVDGQQVSPLALTQALLFPKWTFEEGEEDLTVMRIIVRGEENGKPKTYRWDLYEPYSKEERATSMSRTTALPCTIMARMLVDGTFKQPGVHPPELLGSNKVIVDRMLGELAERGITYTATTS